MDQVAKDMNTDSELRKAVKELEKSTRESKVPGEIAKISNAIKNTSKMIISGTGKLVSTVSGAPGIKEFMSAGICYFIIFIIIKNQLIQYPLWATY